AAALDRHQSRSDLASVRKAATKQLLQRLCNVPLTHAHHHHGRLDQRLLYPQYIALFRRQSDHVSPRRLVLFSLLQPLGYSSYFYYWLSLDPVINSKLAFFLSKQSI